MIEFHSRVDVLDFEKDLLKPNEAAIVSPRLREGRLPAPERTLVVGRQRSQRPGKVASQLRQRTEPRREGL